MLMGCGSMNQEESPLQWSLDSVVNSSWFVGVVTKAIDSHVFTNPEHQLSYLQLSISCCSL